jgi:hypothetical protein
MGPEKHQKVLERLATGDKPTIVIERQSDEKMRVTSGRYVFFRDRPLRRRRTRCVAGAGFRTWRTRVPVLVLHRLALQRAPLSRSLISRGTARTRYPNRSNRKDCQRRRQSTGRRPASLESRAFVLTDFPEEIGEDCPGDYRYRHDFEQKPDCKFTAKHFVDQYAEIAHQDKNCYP